MLRTRERQETSADAFAPAVPKRNGGETRVFVDLVVRDNGDLVLEGQDIGAAPQESFGDSDYEYWLTIRSEDKTRVLEELLAESGETGAATVERDALLLDLLAAPFNESATPVSDLKAWLEARSIPFEFDSYA